MIICADDYGLREDIDEAILELCGLGRLSAVSCMVLLKRCDTAALSRLLAHQTKVDIGLHLCLTDEGLPLALPPPEDKFPGFKSLFRRAVLGRINPRDMARRISAQYELFVAKCGRRPDHIDGHLYVHQLPGVRAALADFVRSLPPEHRPYIRNTRMSAGMLRRQKLPWVKAAVIGAFGRKMHGALEEAAVPTNDGFAGIYDFKQWRNYSGYLPKFAACLRRLNGILVVHPGLAEDWRRQEFESLRKFAPPDGRLNRYQHSSPQT
jgi:chitin disaccharide deacetylase